MRVDVCMITYNHEAYIREAIQSFLAQETAYDLRLIIGEDNSKDGTRRICEEFAQLHPSKIVLLLSESNLGMMKNFIRTFQACTGEFIAFLEGDDFWTDPRKIDKQVEFLSANKDYSACFHNVSIKMQRNKQDREWVLHPKGLPKKTFDTIDVLGPWFIPSPSFMLRNYPDFKLPDWFHNCKYGDLPLMLLLTLCGKFRYLDENLGVYRLHDTGVSTVHAGYDKIIVMTYIYESFNIHTNYQFKDAIRNSVIYEVDRHVPPKPTPDSKGKTDNFSIVSKIYRKIKERLSHPYTDAL